MLNYFWLIETTDHKFSKYLHVLGSFVINLINNRIHAVVFIVETRANVDIVLEYILKVALMWFYL